MNRKDYMTEIRKLISFWMTEIAFENADTYYDINKVSEHLCRQLINLLYGYELIDLNKIKSNFPGLDIGDPIKSKIAYQVTSRTDREKINKSLKSVVSKNYHTTFSDGIKFLILNQGSKVDYGPRAINPATILPTFDISRDIVYPVDLISRIEEIYESENDLITFTRISSLLTKELSPRFPKQENEKQKEDITQLQNLLKVALEKLDNANNGGYSISRKFLDGDLTVPEIRLLIDRPELTEYFRSIIDSESFLWIQGPISTGKTSVAVNLSHAWGNQVFWIDSRDIEAGGLVEHIIGLLCGRLNIDLGLTYKATVKRLAETLESETLIVLNDLPQLSHSTREKDQLSYFIGQLISANIAVAVTSNFEPPVDFGDYEGFNALPEVIPPFLNEDTEQLLKIMDAPAEIISTMAKIITASSQGHPLIIKSAIKYLKEKDWKVDEAAIVSIFSGSFDIGRDRASYQRLINETSSTNGRALLYRLQFVIGSFDIKTVLKVAAIEPAIQNPEDQLSELLGTWIQQNQGGKYQLSPLVKKLAENVSEEMKRQVYLELANLILVTKSLSIFEASSAIFYLHMAKENNRAAYLLITALIAVKTYEMFTGSGLDIFWYNSQLPTDIAPFLQAQIRAVQIALTEDNEKIRYLNEDLQKISNQEGAGAFEQLLAAHYMVMLELRQHPLLALDQLLLLKDASEKLEKEFNLDQPLTSDEIYFAIWLAFTGLKSIEEYKLWFDKIDPKNFPPQIFDDQSIEEYQIAAASIYRNAVLHENEFEKQSEVLKEILVISLEKELWLFAAYAAKYLIKIYAENGKLEEAVSIVEAHESLLNKSDTYKLLVYAELGNKAYMAGKQDLAMDFISSVMSKELPVFYPEMLDFNMTVSQLYAKENPGISAAFSKAALNLTSSNDIYLIEDRIKQHGEAAIGEAHIGQYQESLKYLAIGYELTLDHFQDNDEYRAMVIRFGHVIMYINKMLEHGYAQGFKEKDFIIPYAGFFYKTNEKLLEGGFYFEERKSLVATLINDGFENILDKESAKKWAFIALDQALDTEGGKFVPILEKVVFYLIEDSEFAKAYNVLAFVDRFYKQIAERIGNGSASAEDKEIFERAKNTKAIASDFGVYLHILLPAALKFSKNIRNGSLEAKDYQKSIDSAFENGQYQPRDPNEFDMAKDLFEQIMIGRIEYAQMKEIIDKSTSSNKDIIYAITCYLLSSFTDAAQAANLQLATILVLEKAFRPLKAFYYFLLVPYFEDFWKNIISKNSTEFSGIGFLVEKGLPLIDKTPPEKRIAKIFQVLNNHLSLQLTEQTEAFIFGDS